MDRGVEGLDALLEPLGLRCTRQQTPAELSLHLPGNPVRRHQVVEQAEGGAHGDSGAIDGGEQGMQVPRLDRPSALQDQAAQGQQVVLGDRVEEVLGHVQGQVDQAGRCDGRVQSLPGQVQPRQPDPRRAVEAAGLGDANPQAVAGDRSDQVRLALGEDAYGDVAQGLAIFKPLGGHVAEPERGLGGHPVGLLVIGEAVARVPQECLPILLIQPEGLTQRAEGLGGSGLIGPCRRFLLGHGARVPLLVRRDPYGEMFQTSTSRQPRAVSPTTPPTSQPTLQARVTFSGTGIGPIARSPERIGSSQSRPGSTRLIQKCPSTSLPYSSGAFSASQSSNRSRSFWLAGRSRAVSPTSSLIDSSSSVWPFSTSHLASFLMTVPAAFIVSWPAMTLRGMK